jgi:hypothetical protein
MDCVKLRKSTVWIAGAPTDLYLVQVNMFGKEPPVPIGWEVGWTPEPVWTTWRRENSCPYRNSNSDTSVV